MLTFVEAKSFIQDSIEKNDVILFMKGSASSPACGFSSVVVQILNRLNIPFVHVNVMLEPEVRSAIKEYSSWPTIPQLYIRQEFVGGCDIVQAMFKSGELEELFKNKNIGAFNG